MTRETRSAVIRRGSLCVPGVLLCLFLSGSVAEAAQQKRSPIGRNRLAQTLREGGDVSSGDLNGDRLADLVLTARGNPFRPGFHNTLEIRLSGGATGYQIFQFSFRRGGLAITARDVDGDLDLDLVVTARLTGEGIGILINDGTGVFSFGTMKGRQPWVWGQGQCMIDGDPDEVTSLVTPAGNEDASAEEVQTGPVFFRASRIVVRRRETVAAQTRGAFYIRPPPSFL